MRVIGAALTVLVITALGCSSPTAPSTTMTGGRALQALGGFSVTTQASRDACGAYTGAAKGACQQLVALDCDSSGSRNAGACQDAIGRFVDATGVYPPFFDRVYISRDPQQCLLIRWACYDPYPVSFSDSTGCGCQK